MPSSSELPDPRTRAAIATLRDPATIRARCARILGEAEAGRLDHFALARERLSDVAARVVATTRAAYPTLEIPIHGRFRHFAVGGVDRLPLLAARLGDPAELEMAELELVVTSVLLDAGAGGGWSYAEAGGERYARSEGLAVASFHMFLAGGFANDAATPRADAAALQGIDEAALGRWFQVGPTNPLVGLAGRAGLLRRLGEVVAADPRFGPSARLGGLVGHLKSLAPDGRLPAARLLGVVLDTLGPIWPGRVSLGGVNLGDVWPHPALSGPDPGDDLVPFHKLSQWLSYSLLEPLARAGLEVTDLDALTGLPEYRNGGLFVDAGLLVPRHPAVTELAHAPGSAVVVEWRALTVALLDEVAREVRAALGLSAAELPLARVLEGGTWAAGRAIARELRPDGGPPIRIGSDGTVF